MRACALVTERLLRGIPLEGDGGNSVSASVRSSWSNINVEMCEEDAAVLDEIVMYMQAGSVGGLLAVLVRAYREQEGSGWDLGSALRYLKGGPVPGNRGVEDLLVR